MPRLNRSDLFMEIAGLFAERSTCERGHVGAVIVKEKHIISHGYNGAPSGMPQCDEVGCDTLEVYTKPNSTTPRWVEHQLGCQRAIHAEANAIAYAAKVGVKCDGAVMYSTAEPCKKCSELIIQAGIMAVHYDNPYRLGAKDFLDSANIIVHQHVWTPRTMPIEGPCPNCGHAGGTPTSGGCDICDGD